MINGEAEKQRLKIQEFIMKRLLAILVTGSLVACASNDNSQYVRALEEDGYGYSESQITDNRYRVNFNGNSTTTSNEVKDMALLRAAELTRLNDYDWFRVMNQELTEDSTERTSVSTGLPAGRDVYRSCGLFGCTTTVSPAYSTIDITTRPGNDVFSTSIEIVMGAGEVEDRTAVYDASELYAFLSDKY